MKFLRNIKSQRGDTILEVLIAVAVLSLVLTISLALTNNSTQGNRQSQERGEAVKHTNAQMEQLKAYISQTATPDLPPSGSKFCMKIDGSRTDAISGTIPNNAQDETFAAFQDTALADCKKGDFYYTYIERNGNTFTAHTRWEKVGGGGVDESTMVHRIYPDMASGNLGGDTDTVQCPANFGLNSSGGCTPCPNGYSSPGGLTSLSACEPILPKVLVNVMRIRPAAGNNTPSCGSTNVEPKAGTSVTLSKPAFSATRTTDASSQAVFGQLQMNTQYSANVTPPANYNVCPNNPQSVTTRGYGPSPGIGTEETLNFKIQPVCRSVDDYGWVNYPWWHDHYEWRITSTWFAHTGPDWGPWGPPESNPRWNIGNAKSGYPPQHWEGSYPNRVRYDLHHVGSNGGWYNRFTEQAGWGWVYVGGHWHDDWRYVKVGSHMECPS